jgi:hypothetical protein
MRGAVVMLLIPLVIVLVLARLADQLAGVHTAWQDMVRGVATLLFLYIIVMRMRHRRYFQ